jgi:hypothetical protein
MSNNPIKKPRKNIKKKQTTETTDFVQNLNNIKSIKIPEKFEEKEKLFHSLKIAISEIDSQIKNLKSRREYYIELVEVLDKEIIQKKNNKFQRNDSISIIQEELYSKY